MKFLDKIWALFKKKKKVTEISVEVVKEPQIQGLSSTKMHRRKRQKERQRRRKAQIFNS